MFTKMMLKFNHRVTESTEFEILSLRYLCVLRESVVKFILILILSIVASAGHLDASLQPHKSTKQEVFATFLDQSISPAKLRETYSFHDGTLLAALYSFGNKRQPQEVLLLWRQSPKGYTLAHKMETLAGETFDKPVPFAANHLNFLNVSTEPAGSGGFVVDTMLWLAPDGTIHPVDFKQASEVYESLVTEDEVVITGGEKEFYYLDDQMHFQFSVAVEGDPHCCPSGGIVTGTYKLRGEPKYDDFSRRYKADFQIIVDQIQQVPTVRADNE